MLRLFKLFGHHPAVPVLMHLVIHKGTMGWADQAADQAADRPTQVQMLI